MKKIIFIILILLTGCTKSFIQIFDTSTRNCKSQNGFFVFENDTLKITYSFWASKGVMSFAVYNKLNKPIYVDWKNSSFIQNDNKMDYWVDETQSNIISYYGGYFYNGPLLKPGYTVTEGIQASTSSTIKPERITSIPPKSNYYRSQFYLLPVEFYKINLNCLSTVVSRNDKPSKNSIVYYEDFLHETSPLKYRNYLAITFSENSQEFTFYDNEFYISSVKEMDYRHFRGKLLGTDENGNRLYQKSYKNDTSFYIKISSKYNSVLFRKKYSK